METSLEIVPATTKQVPSIINWNYEDIKGALSDFLVKYDAYQVSEETLPEDKKTRAELNKISKSIEDFRKTVKKEISKPIDIFEDQCKELSGMVVDVSGKIDKTVKEFEEKKKEEKRKIAQDIISALVEESGLPKDYADRIEFKESFTNLTATKAQVENDVSEQIAILNTELSQFLQNVEVIKTTLESANKRIKTKLFLDDYTGQLKYKTIGEIITLINTRTEQIEASEIAKPEEIKPIEIPKIETPKEDEPILTVQIEVTGTKAQINALAAFMKTNNIASKRLN